MAERSKHHHFVPKVLQRSFCFEGERIWYVERNSDGRFMCPEPRNIRSCFRSRNYYTVLADGKPSDLVERKFYGKIDDYLGRILPEFFASFGRNEVPTFSGRPLESLRNVIFEMIKRTPEFTKDYNEIDIGKEIVERELISLGKGDPNPQRVQQLEGELNDQQKLLELGRTVRVRSTIQRSKQVESMLEDFVVRWAISRSKHSYVLSSKIVHRIGNGGSNGLSNPNMEIWMPISPKIAIVLLRDPESKIPLTVTDRMSSIRKLNEHAVENSQQIASHSRKLIESLVGEQCGNKSLPISPGTAG